MPWVASGNNTRLTHMQVEPALNDADKFLILLVQMGLCFGGKQPDNKLKLSPDSEKKAKGAAKPGTAISRLGLLHSFIQGGNIAETLWFNLLTQKEIAGQTKWKKGLGTPPWEKMPEGENCPVAEDLKRSLMGRLVPMARFCLLTDSGIKFTEGLVHQDYDVGMIDPSAAMKTPEKKEEKTKVLWANPEKRPWRLLPALLSFLDAQSSSGFDCLGLKCAVEKIKKLNPNDYPFIGFWSGGVKVNFNSGEQHLAGRDDMVESEFKIELACLGETWFAEFSGIMSRLESLGKQLYNAVNAYYSDMSIEKNPQPEATKPKKHKQRQNDMASEATGLFWQMVEPTYQYFLDVCQEDNTEQRDEKLISLFNKYSAMAFTVYDEVCPHDTARQFETWIKKRRFGIKGIKNE